ncbi:MAG: SH3 domain-containing protein [Lautropia sp.]
MVATSRFVGRLDPMRMKLPLAAALLVAAAAVQAQGPAGGRSAAPPATPPATPQVIVPSATLGPAAPGVSPAGKTGAATGAAGSAATAVSSPRPAGVVKYRSVARPNAVMFDAPSEKAKKIYQAPEGMPVEVISVLRTWVKVRDPLGDLAWLSRDDLADRRMVIATSVAPLRREADQAAPTWFSVDRGVVLELLDEKPVNGFVKVQYAEGQVGYLLSGQVWGL